MLTEQDIQKALHADHVVALGVPDLHGPFNPGKRPFGIYLAATMTPVTLETANGQRKPVMARVESRGPFNFPVCVFYFTVKDDQGYYCWAYEPIIRKDGRPELKYQREARCKKLDDDSLDAIVDSVNRWYDAFYATITT